LSVVFPDDGGHAVLGWQLVETLEINGGGSWHGEFHLTI
jgi:hypothetical protein